MHRAKMQWADIEDGAIWVVQLKTKAKLLVPLYPELRKALSAWGVADGPILKTSFNKAFTSKGFSNFMADRIKRCRFPRPLRNSWVAKGRGTSSG